MSVYPKVANPAEPPRLFDGACELVLPCSTRVLVAASRDDRYRAA